MTEEIDKEKRGKGWVSIQDCLVSTLKTIGGKLARRNKKPDPTWVMDQVIKLLKESKR